jgi:hypothetical protein
LEQLEPRLLLSSDPVNTVVAPALVSQPLDTVITVDLTPDQTTAFAEQQEQDRSTIMTVLVEPTDPDRDGLLGGTESEPTQVPSEVTQAASQTILETTTPALTSSFVSRESDEAIPGDPGDQPFSATQQLVETLRVPQGPPEGSSQGIAQVSGGVLVFRAWAGQNNLTLRFGGANTPVLDLLTGPGE